MAKLRKQTPSRNTRAELPPEPEGIPVRSFPELTEDPVRFRIDRLIAQYPDAQIIAKIYEQRATGEEFFLYNIVNPTPEKMSEEAIRNNNRGKGGVFILRVLVDNEQMDERTLRIGDGPGVVPDPVTGSAMNITDPTTALLLREIGELKARLNQPPPQQTSIVELVTALKTLKDLDPPKQEFNTDTMLKFIELGKNLGGGNSTENDWMGVLKDIVKEAAPVVLPMVAAGMRSAGSASPGNPQLPQNGANDAMMEEQLLKQGIAFLKKKALNPSSNPDVYVGLIVDNEGESPYDRLIYRINTEDFSFFAKLDAELANEPYARFFKSIYDGIRSCYRDSDQMDNNSAGSTGDAGNASGDGGADKGRSA